MRKRIHSSLASRTVNGYENGISCNRFSVIKGTVPATMNLNIGEWFQQYPLLQCENERTTSCLIDFYLPVENILET